MGLDPMLSISISCRRPGLDLRGPTPGGDRRGVGSFGANPCKLFNAIFEGKDAQTVWEKVGGEFPEGYFYLKNLMFGDGCTQFGLALSCSVAMWTLIAAAIAYAADRIYLYITLSIWVAGLVGLFMVSIVGIHGRTGLKRVIMGSVAQNVIGAVP